MKKYIGIIEIGSSSIKTLCVNSTVQKASRLEDFDVNICRIKKPDKTTTLQDFEIHYLPEIHKLLFRMQNQKIHRLHIIMTGAWRELSNSEDIALLIQTKTGQKIHVLSTEEEGLCSTLSFLLTARDEVNINQSVQNINIDLGGDSTEISIYTNPSHCQTVSLPIGTSMVIEKMTMDSANSFLKRMDEICLYNAHIIDQYFQLSIGDVSPHATLSSTGGVIKKTAQEILDPLGTGKGVSRRFIHNNIITREDLVKQRLLDYRLIGTTVSQKRILEGAKHGPTRDALFRYIYLDVYLIIMKNFKIKEIVVNASGVSYGYYFHLI